MTKCTLTLDSGAIAVKTPYDPGFVSELKSKVQPEYRRWKNETKQWLVAPHHGPTVQDLCNKYFGEMPLLPTVATSRPKVTQKILDVRYIGQTKDRGSDERSAFGWTNGGWNVVFPETVLRGWFDAPANPDEQPTLYAILNVKRDASEEEVKAGFRRMAFQWHPDRCKEPNAHEQFIAIQRAYKVLNNADKRGRYDAGLALEASVKNTPKSFDASQFHGYRSPLRCGLIMCEGIETMGLFQVSKIFAWEDVRDQYNRTLVVSWKQGDDHFTEVWA